MRDRERDKETQRQSWFTGNIERSREEEERKIKKKEKKITKKKLVFGGWLSVEIDTF